MRPADIVSGTLLRLLRGKPPSIARGIFDATPSVRIVGAPTWFLHFRAAVCEGPLECCINVWDVYVQVTCFGWPIRIRSAQHDNRTVYVDLHVHDRSVRTLMSSQLRGIHGRGQKVDHSLRIARQQVRRNRRVTFRLEV